MNFENSAIKKGLVWAIWPVLLTGCIGLTAYGFETGMPLTFFNIAYVCLAITLIVLERVMPHEKKWLAHDGQTFASIAHTFLSKGTVQGLLIFGGIIGLTDYFAGQGPRALGWWPYDWPLVFQIALALVVSEFMLYWAHRLAHEWPLLWRFHAVHHSVEKLWVVNTGRFHFVDSLISVILGSSILIVLGAPLEIIKWLSAITAFIGMLTHCNVEMKFGPISWIFNTPGLHRWHHSKKLIEGNRNYGENLMIWDHVFGTWINPDRRPPANIGITEAMPSDFVDQLLFPFRYRRYKKSPKTGKIEKT